MERKPPILDGRELSLQELEAIRVRLESFDVIERVSNDMRELIANQWPHLLAKLCPPN
jgi:hypothetical protein